MQFLCGNTADFTIEIAQKIAPGSDVTGVDISEGMMELIVRLRSLAGRRQVQTAPVPQTYRIGEFTFHPDTLRLDYAGTSEELSPREAKILELLCASKGETLYTRPLLLEIWGDDDFFNSRSLQVFISKLRRRLEPDPRIRIVNVRGEGYKLLVNE